MNSVECGGCAPPVLVDDPNNHARPVARFDLAECFMTGDPSMVQRKDGQYVLAADYDALLKKNAKLLDFAKYIRETSFEFLTEGIRPWPHHIRDFAWRADEVLKDGDKK